MEPDLAPPVLVRPNLFTFLARDHTRKRAAHAGPREKRQGAITAEAGTAETSARKRPVSAMPSPGNDAVKRTSVATHRAFTCPSGCPFTAKAHPADSPDKKSARAA